MQDVTGSAEKSMERPAQFSKDADGAMVQAGGMTLKRLEDLMSDIRYQPLWRSDADKCCDYYDGYQLTAERLERMERLGIPPIITNLIGPVVNSVLGLEAKNRTDARVSEADEAQQAPEELMLAMNARLNEAERESMADMATSEAYASLIKAGVGWVEVGLESDPFLYRYRVQAVHRNEIWWDWRAQRLDLMDARYLVRKRRYDKDHLIAVMPEHERLIRYAVEDRFGSWQLDLEGDWDTDLMMAAHNERVTNIDSSDWRDAERDRATVYEVWYREWKRGKFLELPNGRMILFDKRNPAQMMAIERGWIVPTDRVYSDVRLAFYLGCHRLYDMPTPYPHRYFPYVPMFGYREDRSGIRYGMIRGMLSPQDVVNSADAKMHMLLNSKRVVADSDIIDGRYNTWRDVRDEVASPQSMILLDPSKRGGRFEIDSDGQLSAQQFNRRMQAAGDIENAAGVYKAMLGKEGAATSGVGINSLIEQSTVMLSEITDNFAFGKRMVRELLFSLVKQDIIDKEIRVPIKRDGKKEIIVLNQRVVDQQTGQQVINNDIKSIEFKVAMNEIPNTASFKQQQLQVLIDTIKGLPPDVQMLAVPTMLKLTDAPDKDEMAEAVRRKIGIGPKLTDEQQAAADEQTKQEAGEIAALNKRVAVANAELAEVKVEKERAATDKIDAERLVRMVEAMYSAMQSGQIVATIPQVAPVADKILEGAGYKDAEVPQAASPVAPQQQNAPMDGTRLPDNAPAPQSPLIGSQQGIETVRNDGSQISPAQA